MNRYCNTTRLKQSPRSLANNSKFISFINCISAAAVCAGSLALGQLAATEAAELKQASKIAVPTASSGVLQVVIDRKARHMTVTNAAGKKIYDTDIGIGRGGLAKKKTMEDCITPSGTFKVDLILYNPAYNVIEPGLLARYEKDPRAAEYLKSAAALQKLFSNMNSIDFNGDSKPDTAYGVAYVGLDSASEVTGPKLSSFNGTTYWFSIALHGTSNEKKNIGFANSGGCLQIPEAVLKPMIESRMLRLGTEVTIK